MRCAKRCRLFAEMCSPLWHKCVHDFVCARLLSADMAVSPLEHTELQAAVSTKVSSPIEQIAKPIDEGAQETNDGAIDAYCVA
jgi:hypothetical protein